MTGGYDGPLASDTPATPDAGNDNNVTGTKIDIGGGKTVIIESDLDNTHLGGHVPEGKWEPTGN